MAKDKSRTIVFTTTVLLPNGSKHHFHFRKEASRDRFTALATELDGIADAYKDTILYVYEEADNALNTLANYINRKVMA